MQTALLAATVTALAASALAPIDSARAASAPKPPELATVGAAVHPGRLTGAVARLTRAPGASRPSIVETGPSVAKQPDFVTAQEPGASLSQAQREKLAAGLAGALPAPTATTTGKPDELTTILPRAASVRSPEAPTSAKTLPSEVVSPLRSAAGRVSSALGVIPRPEWSAGAGSQKPQDVSTMGPASAPLPVPTAAELQRRAVRSGAPPKGVTAKAAKSGNISASRPRDPSLPPPSPTKAPASEKLQEVQP